MIFPLCANMIQVSESHFSVLLECAVTLPATSKKSNTRNYHDIAKFVVETRNGRLWPGLRITFYRAESVNFNDVLRLQEKTW